jgi:hypothetical protein
MIEKYKITKEYKGYVNGPESTKIDPRYMVTGSKNMLVGIDQLTLSKRPGMEIIGAAATSNHGILGATEWKPTTGLYHVLRAYDRFLEVLVDGSWYQLKTDLSSPRFQAAPYFVSSEKQDILVFVNGESKHYNWPGGVAKVASNTANSITLQGVRRGTTIAFAAGTPATITDSANGFVTAGFAAGDVITVSGSAANSRKFTVATVAAGTLTLIADDAVTTEAAGPTVTIHTGYPTWKSRGFVIAGTRLVIVNGTEYAYTGGEDTETLTGLSGLPAFTAGDVVLSGVRSNNNHASLPTGFTNDFCAVQRNQLWLGSSKSREVWASKTADFTDFAFTANRLPGEGIQLILDAPCAGFEASEEDITVFDQSDGLYGVTYALSSDNTKEAVTIDKRKTSAGQGLIAPGAKVAIKNAVAYITTEPTLDTVGNVENLPNEQAKPISDPIKNDFDAYDFTDASMRYWKRNIAISLPAESVLLLYDLRYAMWQPPQIFGNIGQLSIAENGDLIGHSVVGNESFRLFTGTMDNDIAIDAVARFSWNNYGTPEAEKGFDRYFVEGFLSANEKITTTVRFEQGSLLGEQSDVMDALDEQYIFGVSDINWLGKNPLGSRPVGGGGLGEQSPLLRFRKMIDFEEVPFYEFQVEFGSSEDDAQFIITNHGPNVTMREDNDPFITSE